LVHCFQRGPDGLDFPWNTQWASILGVSRCL
jgi:hypothetical protein